MLDKLLNLAKAIAAAVIPGTSQAVEAAQAIAAVVAAIKPTLTSQDQAALDAGLKPLLDQMNRSVDQAVADLKGE